MTSSQPKVPVPELDRWRLEESAIDAFFADYVVIPGDRSLSRGFLDGLEYLVERAGPSSDIARAAKIVALAGIGKRKERTNLVSKAKVLYGDLLCSFQKTLLAGAQEATMIDSLMTAVLLGIFEVSITHKWDRIVNSVLDIY